MGLEEPGRLAAGGEEGREERMLNFCMLALKSSI